MISLTAYNLQWHNAMTSCQYKNLKDELILASGFFHNLILEQFMDLISAKHHHCKLYIRLWMISKGYG